MHVMYICIDASTAFLYTQTKGTGSYHFISATTVSTMQTADKKLTFIPIVFILLRMWGTMQLFYALIQTHNIYYGCIPHKDWIGFAFFAYLQVCFCFFCKTKIGAFLLLAVQILP